MENRIKVLIADGSEAFCGHLKSELQQLDGYDLVGTAADGEEAVRLLEATKPDILVLDLMLASGMASASCVMPMGWTNHRLVW